MFISNESIEDFRDRMIQSKGLRPNNLSTAPGGLEFLGRVRFVEVGDAACWKRREQILSLFGPVDFYELSHNNISGLMQSEVPYEIIIVSADDVQRLALAIAPPADIVVRRKLSFVYSSRSTPKMRARILRLGFDDALHARMTPLEVIMRIRSMISRMEIYQAKNIGKVSEGVWKDFCERHVAGRLQKKQVELLQSLVAANGDVVPYSELATFDFTEHVLRLDSLKVTVSRLRRYLVDCDIEVSRGCGYYLKMGRGDPR